MLSLAVISICGGARRHGSKTLRGPKRMDLRPGASEFRPACATRVRQRAPLNVQRTTRRNPRLLSCNPTWPLLNACRHDAVAPRSTGLFCALPLFRRPLTGWLLRVVRYLSRRLGRRGDARLGCASCATMRHRRSDLVVRPRIVWSDGWPCLS